VMLLLASILLLCFGHPWWALVFFIAWILA
jgi:hypothetical protein